ncbi:MAG: class I SAM-dependent methyltransferase [Thermodesulfobacteriota bacterium]
MTAISLSASKDDFVSTREVRNFWDRNPLCSHLIPSEPGTEAFFRAFDRMRSDIESDEFVERTLAPSKHRGLWVLDVGCGNGYTLAKFARAGARAMGVDLSYRAVDITRKRMALGRFDIPLVQADAEGLPFRDNSFNLVYSLGVLHHSPHVSKAIREIRRVLRPGGKTVLMLYNKNSVFYRLRIPAMKYLNPRFRGWTIQQVCNHLDGAGNPLGRFFSREEVRGMMSGFSRFDFQPAYFSHLHFPGKPDIFPQSVCRRIGERFGWFLYVSARKD